MTDLQEQIKNLSPGALALFKKRLGAMPDADRSRVYSTLSGIPELADIVGTSARDIGPAPMIQAQPEKSYWGKTAEEITSPFTRQDVPLWKKALAGVALPFTAVSEYAIKPLAATVASPFTPATAGTEGKNWLDRELQEYKAWDDPNWGFLGVKGALETLPWLALPGVGAVAGAGGKVASGVAGALGKLGTAGKVAGTALEYSPWGLIEKGAGAATKAAVKGVKTVLGKGGEKAAAAAPTSTMSFDDFSKAVTKEAGIPIDYVDKSWHDSHFYTAGYKGVQPHLEVGTKGIPKGVDRDNFLKIVSLHELGHKLGPSTARRVGVEAEGQAWKFVAANAERFGVDLTDITNTIKTVHPEYGREAVMSQIIKPSLANKIVEAHNLKGGSTFDMSGKNLMGEDLYSIGAYPNRTMKVAGSKITKEQVDDFAFKNSDLLDQPRHTIGTWADKEGNTVFDVAVTRDNIDAAMALGREKNQEAIYYLKGKGKELPVSGPAMPEYARQNILQSAGEGKPGLGYMSNGLVYRSPEGKPVAVVTVIPQASGELRIGSIVTDDKSMLKGKAVKAIVDDLKNYPTGIKMPPISEMSPEAAALVSKFEKATIPEAVQSGEKIAKEVGVHFDGIQQGIGNQFTDPVTGSTFYGNSVEDVATKLAEMRKKFGVPNAEPVAGADKALGVAKGAPVGTQAMPGGFNAPQEAAIGKLVSMVKSAKPLRKETEALYKEEAAKRIAEYEDSLQKYITSGRTPEEANHMALRDLAGKYPQTKVTEEINSIRGGMTPDEVQQLFGVVADGTYASGYTRINTFTALQNVLLNKIPTNSEIRLLEETFGADLVKELLKKRDWLTKAKDFVLDLANAPRALLASGDISGLLRQGGILSAAHPIEAMRTVRPMVEAMFSSKNELLMDRIIRSRPFFELAEKNGLYIAPITSKVSVRLAEREEVFMSKLMNKIPFVRGSNRAYVTGLNDLRTRIWEKTIAGWQKAGVKVGEQDYKDLAQLINWATGRGTLPKAISQQGALLNAMFFSPRLIFSRLELPTAILPSVTKSALVRKEAWRTLLSAVGVGASILTACQLSGAAKIELDPRAADFGKLKIGNTRLDIWTGYAQYIRFAAQLATAQRKTEAGYTQPLNRKEIVDRFASTKFSPAVGLINDLLKGQTYLGEDLPPKDAKSVLGQVYQRLTPLSIQDLIDGVSQDGPLGGITASAGVLGVGVVTYTDDVKKARDAAAKAKFNMSWDEVGLKYGRAAQLTLEQQDKKIMEAEKEQERQYSTGSISNMKQWQNEGESIESTYRNAINLASKEFRSTGDGVKFKDKVDSAATTRRDMYAARNLRPEYQSIVSYYNKPLTPEQTAKMNPGDIARKEYYRMMYGADMYDTFGNYNFDLAARREQEFITKYGQQSMDYIEEYQGSQWLDKPAELTYLEQSREVLKPYWQVTDYVWSLYPPELKALSDQITLLERTDPATARQALKRYPSILRARELIAKYKKQLRQQNPAVQQAYSLFYGS